MGVIGIIQLVGNDTKSEVSGSFKFDELMLWPLGLDFWDWPAFPESVERVDHLLNKDLRLVEVMRQWFLSFRYFQVMAILEPIGRTYPESASTFFFFMFFTFLMHIHIYTHPDMYIFAF